MYYGAEVADQACQGCICRDCVFTCICNEVENCFLGRCSLHVKRPEPRVHPDNPRNLEEWLVRLRRYERDIYVREQVNGTWDSVSLDNLTPEQWGKHVARWLQDGSIPVRILRQAES